MTTEIRVIGAGGEYMESVVVVEWRAAPGERVLAGECVVVVETAKSATEIAAPASGVLSSICAQTGDEVEVNGLLGTIAAADGDSRVPSGTSVQGRQTAQVTAPVPRAPAAAGVSTRAAGDRILASPAARRAAAEFGIDLREIAPTSPSGRIKLRDLAGAQVGRGAATGGLYVSRRQGIEAGVPVVFLHGFASDSASWYPLFKHLSRKRTTLAVDLPCHGKSPVGMAQDLTTLKASVVAALHAQDITEAHLVGHSLGAAVAMSLAADTSLSIRSMALLAPVGLGARIDAECLVGIAKASTADGLAPWLRRLVADQSLIDGAFLGVAAQSRQEAPQRLAQIEMIERLLAQGIGMLD